MDEKKLSGLIGLCMRARQLTLGTDMALRTVREGRAALLLMDAGASANLRKKLKDVCWTAPPARRGKWRPPCFGARWPNRSNKH